MRPTIFRIAIAVAVFSMLLAACSPAATQAPAATEAPAATQAPAATDAPVAEPTTVTEAGVILPDVDPASLEGAISSAGSSTVYPLIEAVAENFYADGFEGMGEINIASVGTGGGFERFCKTGETDIANASRAIKDSEAEACAALTPARTPVEFRVGTDAIVVVVSAENDFVTALTMEQLATIFSDKVVNWSEIDPSWPNEPIQRFTPGTDSGTFDFFVETAIQKPLEIKELDDAKKVVLAAANLQTSEDDNVLVQGVEGSPYAIGYFGFAYFQENSGNLKALELDGVAPSFESAESGEYKLSRPLFLYSDAGIMQAKPQVAGFINYFLTNVNDLIQDVGYFPASQEALDEARQNWLDAVE